MFLKNIPSIYSIKQLILRAIYFLFKDAGYTVKRNCLSSSSFISPSNTLLTARGD